MKIPFNIPYSISESIKSLYKTANSPKLVSSKFFTKKCENYFEERYKGYKALMTNSSTSALEIIARCIGFKNKEEVIMPSYNYVGVANAFHNAGAKIVFADIDPATMNISTSSIFNNISNKTKAVLIMHYGGVACDMEEIVRICRENKLILIEDNAQGINCSYKNSPLGSFGDFSTISFDSMKNISIGEGGVLLYKKKYHDKVIDIYNNGTNKESLETGRVKNYEWVTSGLKYGMSEYLSALLLPLLEQSEEICNCRKKLWDYYFESFLNDEKLKILLPNELKNYNHNGHLFYIKLENEIERKKVIDKLKHNGVSSAFHYSPLHLSKMAKKQGYKLLDDKFTSKESEKLLRLPICNNLTFEDIDYIVKIFNNS